MKNLLWACTQSPSNEHRWVRTHTQLKNFFTHTVLWGYVNKTRVFGNPHQVQRICDCPYSPARRSLMYLHTT